MPFQSQKPSLNLTREERKKLIATSQARKESTQRVERAKILLAYADGNSVSAIARMAATNRPKIGRLLDKALQLGPIAALDDFRRSGRPSTITPEARAWLVALACQKPKELGYSYELWTTDLLARHARQHCQQAGHPSLLKLGRGTVSKILASHRLKPHKVRYFLERRDPDFDQKMVQVLHVYRQVEMLRERPNGGSGEAMVAYLSYDEKPGIQAICNTTPDLPPVPGELPTWARDHEYVRKGTRTLMAGIDLLTGHVHGLVVRRHRSCEFIEFLQTVSAFYPKEAKIRIVLDNHSAHTSKETRAYLTKQPNRFEFIFTPKHGSWLNLIESFFAKMAKTMLRAIRVDSAEELEQRIGTYLEEVNETPNPFRWKYGLDELTVV